MHTNPHTLKKGFTLIELIISMSLILMILTMVLFTFKFQNDTYNKLYESTYNRENLRFLSIILETQVRATPKMYILNDQIYLKDLESPQYYNYYTLNNRMVMKTKTDKYLDSIGLGSTSQIAGDIDEFSLNYTDQGNLRLYLSTTYQDKKYVVEKEIKFMGKVIMIKN